MSKKRVGIIIGIVIVVAVVIAVGLWFLLRGGAVSNGDKVYVESVKDLTGINYGVQDRYSGVVEPQESQEIKKNPEKTVKEVFVHEGDIVEVGTPLFEYDTESIKSQIAQAELELEGIGNEIADYNNQIKTLQSERAQVSDDEKFQYTTQIQSIQTSIKQAEYNKESKRVEIENLQKSIENAVVASELAGVVKSISENGYDPYTGNELPYMTILAVGDYRIKGTVSEQNIWSITPGAQALIRSRVDEDQIWTGTISEVDTNNEVTNNNNGYYYSSSSGETATKYPFYITLDSADGLMLGQHVYIEMDMGQVEVKEGIRLYESYIVMDGDSAYVWADNGRSKLEKRTVELGEYDGMMGTWQILSGLTEEDYIAYPMAAFYEGVTTVTNAEEVDYSSPMYMEENEGMMEDGMMDGEMIDGEMMDGGIMDGEMMDGEMPVDGMMDGEMLDDGAMDIMPESVTDEDGAAMYPEEGGEEGVSE